MRRFRFAVAITAAVAIGAGCAFALWSGLSPSGLAGVARTFVVQVVTPPSQPSVASLSGPSAQPGSANATRTMPTSPKRTTKPVQTGSIVVRFKANDAKTREFVAAKGGRVIQSSAGRLVASLPTPKGSTPNQYQASLAKRDDVLYASADEVGRLQPVAYTPPVDSYLTSPIEYHWWLDAVGAQKAWQTGFGSASTPLRGSAGAFKVAVIDTGIYMTHPEMANALVGKDEFQSYSQDTGVYTTDNDITPYNSGDPNDVPWHGTATSGAIGAAVNGLGTVGVGYNVIPVGYKIQGPVTSGGSVIDYGMSTEAAASAIYDATNSGCKVINMSFGGTGAEDPAMLDAENYANSHGVLMVAAAGNDGNSIPFTPAADPHVLAVSAVATANAAATSYTLASFSNFGPDIALAAPGQAMWLPASDTDLTSWMYVVDGTSFSSPIVAGAAALLWRAAPSLTADQVTTLLESTAVDLGTPGRDDQYGHGMLDMNAAYNSLVAQYPLLSKPATLAFPVYANSHSITATWSPVAGSSVLYAVSLDGSAVATTAATSYTLTGVSEGAHTISVQPTSLYNWWNTGGAISASTTVDVTAPAVSDFAIAGSTLSWSVAETSPYVVQAYIDTATPVIVADHSMMFTGLSVGTHALHVKATDAAGNSSGWITWQFALGVTTPSVESIVVTDALTATVTWPAISGATSYDYSIDGQSVLSTSGAAFTVTMGKPGVVSVQVRSVLPTMTSEWATATVTDVAIVPAGPLVSAPGLVTLPKATISWPSAANAKRYEYRLNGGLATATTATSVEVGGLPMGMSTIEVRSLNNLSQSAWVAVVVTYNGPATSTLTLSATPTRITYPSTTVGLTGSTNSPGARIGVQSSADGHTWSSTGVSWTSAITPLPVTTSRSITRTTYYRLALTGAPGWTNAVSNVMGVPYYALLKTPSAPSSVRHGKSFTAAETISAPARVSASAVTFKFYRWQKSGSKNAWVLKKSVRGTSYTKSGNTTTYRAKQSLSKTGAYRIYASFSGGGLYAASTSAARALRVK